MFRVCVAFAIVCLFMLPERSPIQAQVVVGFESSRTEQQAEARIRVMLAKRLDFRLNEVPLRQLAGFLRQHGIPAQIDQRALEDCGISDDIPISFQQTGVTVRSALNMILHRLDLTWTIRNEVLLITTEEEAESMLRVRLYDISELVPRAQMTDAWGQRVTGRNFDPLIDLIQSTIEPQSWDVVGGPGSVEGLELTNAGILVIAQTLSVHEEVVRLLAGLHQIDRRHGRAAPRRTPPIRRSSGLPRSNVRSRSAIPDSYVSSDAWSLSEHRRRLGRANLPGWFSDRLLRAR
jgi:hypothetical protein